MIIPVILAGGTGTRLWPLSRAFHPKQMLSLIDEKTMLQNTLLRLQGFNQIGDPIVICNDTHRFMVAEQLRIININPASIILEPVGRNTAPAVAIAALMELAKNEDHILLVLPADHYIENLSKFYSALEAGSVFADNGKLITFGIVPDSPETGYGYIRKGASLTASKNGMNSDQAGAYAIEAFVEKPDQETAELYIDSGEYCWNSGMFMFKSSQVIEELETYAPDIVNACRSAVDKAEADLDFLRLDKDAFTTCPSDSIDYAVMEKTTRGVMIPLQAGWNDVGSWEALWHVGKKDKNDNVINGDVLVQDVHRSYLYAKNRLVAAVGLENHIVVETSDAVLVSPRSRVQDVKALVEKLKNDQRIEAKAHKKSFRPWGTSECLSITNSYCVNRLLLKPGAKISLQKHQKRTEHWIVLNGSATVVKGDDTFELKNDESTFIPMGVVHRLENSGDVPLDVIEVQSGIYIGGDDIERIEDDYGRKDI